MSDHNCPSVEVQIEAVPTAADSWVVQFCVRCGVTREAEMFPVGWRRAPTVYRFG